MPAQSYSQYREEDDQFLSGSWDVADGLPRVLRPTLETTESATQQVLKDQRVQHYLLKPKTLPQKIICAISWCLLVSGTAVGCYFLVPLFLKKVVVPLQTKWNPVAVAFLVIFGCAIVPLLLVPAGPFIWLAAVSLGIWKGFLIVQLGTAIGMTLSYFVGKKYLRQRIRAWVERKDWAQALFIAVKEAGPFKVILLMRLGPAPYAWLNYSCSLSSDIQFGPYILASVIGRSLHNLIDIYIGSGVNTAGEAVSGEQLDPLVITFYAIGFVFALCLSLGAYIYAKRALTDLKARALAREQVLTAFSFPEQEEYDDLESAIVQLPANRLHDRQSYKDLEATRGTESDHGSESELVRHSSGDRLLKPDDQDSRSMPESPKRDSNSKRDMSFKQDSEDVQTRLIADCSASQSDRELEQC